MDQLELPLANPYTFRIPFNSALDLFWDRDWQFTVKSKTTHKCFSRLKDFHRFDKIRYMDEISRSSVESLRRHLKALGLAEATVNTHHMILTRAFNFLYELKGTDASYRTLILPERNPGSLVPKVDEKRFARGVAWPKKVIWRLISTAISLRDLDMAEIIEFRYKTPLRPGDFWSLTEKNINLARMIVTGIQKKTQTRKNPSGVPYTLSLTKKTTAILERRINSTKFGEPLFKKFNFQKRWKYLRDAAGMPDVLFKDLRPSAATLLLDNHVDPETVKNILGHTTLRLLPVYAIRSIAHLKKAAQKLEDEKTEVLR